MHEVYLQEGVFYIFKDKLLVNNDALRIRNAISRFYGFNFEKRLTDGQTRMVRLLSCLELSNQWFVSFEKVALSLVFNNRFHLYSMNFV